MSSLLDAPRVSQRQLQRTVFPFLQAKTSKGERGLLTVEGMGVHYGEVNANGFLFVPGAFSESLKERPSERKPLVMGFEHSLFAPLTVIGKWSETKESEDGVWLRGPISDTSDGRDVATLIEDGALTGLSIGHTIDHFQFLEPGQRAEFDTPFGKRTYEVDEWALAVIEGAMVEASVVSVPADDEARIDKVLHSTLTKAGKALPGLAGSAEWHDVAYSMALLMGGRGAAAFADLPELEHRGLYERLASAYRRHGKTPPAYERNPKFSDVAFQHDERALFADRYLRKNLAAVAAGAGGIEGPLSPETREEAKRVLSALAPLARDEAEQLAELDALLRQTTRRVKGTQP
jgi:HK97 family phage prohead protease